jgi:hypothetical protein
MEVNFQNEYYLMFICPEIKEAKPQLLLAVPSVNCELLIPLGVDAMFPFIFLNLNTKKQNRHEKEHCISTFRSCPNSFRPI